MTSNSLGLRKKTWFYSYPGSFACINLLKSEFSWVLLLWIVFSECQKDPKTRKNSVTRKTPTQLNFFFPSLNPGYQNKTPKPPCTNGGWLKLRSSLIAGDKPNYQVCCNLLQKCQLTPQKFQEMINLLADAQKVVEEHCEDMEILSSPETLKRASLPLPDAGPWPIDGALKSWSCF